MNTIFALVVVMVTNDGKLDVYPTVLMYPNEAACMSFAGEVYQEIALANGPASVALANGQLRIFCSPAEVG